MAQSKPLVIFGSAEIASLARFYFDQDSGYEVVAFTVDDEYADDETFDGLPLIPFSDVEKRYPPDTHDMFVGLSYARLNQLRETKYHQAREAGYTLASYVCSKSVIWPDLSIGDNCFILENQTIQPTVKIGNNVMIWSGNHLGHGSHIDDHVYVSSHAVFSGHSTIGKRSFIGVNATIRDFVNIGKDCFVGMDSSITGDVPDGAVVIGISATIYPADDRRAKTLKRKYFGPTD